MAPPETGLHSRFLTLVSDSIKTPPRILTCPLISLERDSAHERVSTSGGTAGDGIVYKRELGIVMYWTCVIGGLSICLKTLFVYRLLSVPWTARSNQSFLKEINSHWKD